jgi:hypothetical protein
MRLEKKVERIESGGGEEWLGPWRLAERAFPA